MKNRLMKNLLLKILSLLAAFLFWLVIINVTDPTMARTFEDIPVQVLNENVITSANQVYEIEDGDIVDVSVKGKRSFIEGLEESDLVATADLSELSKVNAVNINVTLKKEPPSNVEMDWGNAVLKVKLEKRVSKKFKVEVEHQGELSENYVLGEMVAKPNIVEVSCGESKFKKIDHVGVMVILNGESEDFESEYAPILYDQDGEALDGTNVSFSKDAIKVSTQVLTTKKVPVYVEKKGEPAAGYRLVNIDYQPESVRVSGTEDALSQNVSIKIPVDVTNAKNDIEHEIAIEEYLPQNLAVVDEVTSISIRCVIEKSGRRTFTFTPPDIAVKNLPADCTVDFADNTKKYHVVVTGRESDLEKLTLADLGAYVDLMGLGKGAHNLDLRFRHIDGVTIQSRDKAKVIIGTPSDSGVLPTSTVELEPTEPPDEGSAGEESAYENGE